MRKKGFGQKIWLSIMIGLIIMIFIFTFVRFLKGIDKKNTEVTVLEFVHSLGRTIDTTKDHYGSVKYDEYYIGKYYSKICFSEYGKANTTGIDREEIIDIIDNDIQKNIFLYNDKEMLSYYIPDIIIENLSDTKYGCYNITEGYLNLRFEARGYGTVIGPPYDNVTYSDCVIKVPDLMGTGRLDPDKWIMDEKYFRNDSNGIIQVCNLTGWENITVIK